jgi:hypothetical protein
MKLIHHAKDPCRCHDKLEEYEKGLAEGVVLGVGSIVECDCGERYKLIDDQREGPFWKRIIPPLLAGFGRAPSEILYHRESP